MTNWTIPFNFVSAIRSAIISTWKQICFFVVRLLITTSPSMKKNLSTIAFLILPSVKLFSASHYLLRNVITAARDLMNKKGWSDKLRGKYFCRMAFIIAFLLFCLPLLLMMHFQYYDFVVALFFILSWCLHWFLYIILDDENHVYFYLRASRKLYCVLALIVVVVVVVVFLVGVWCYCYLMW